MKRLSRIPALLIALIIGASVVFLSMAIASPEDAPVHRPETAPPAGAELSVVAWNLGYGGLGAASDFVSDGGKHWFPPSRKAVRENVAGIERQLGAMQADVFVTPEIAKRSPVNYWTDLYGAVNRAMGKRERAFHPDLLTKWFPFPLRFEHGLAIFSGRHIDKVVIEPLPLEPTKMGGVVRRKYAARLAYIAADDGSPDWVVIGVHLAAFDEDGLVRFEQLRRVMEIAQQVNAQGHPVILAGDWNMTLAETSFPHTTAAKDLTWLHAFPQDGLPPGWRIGADPATPSVRTNEKPYVKGENYTGVIDGFIVSPDVEIVSVQGVDLAFRNSDHQPVKLIARRKPKP